MGRLHFRYAAMNAGKTTHLLQIAHNYNENGRPVALFTSGLDTRDGPGVVASRLGIRRTAGSYYPETDFFKLLHNATEVGCVLIDETQFMTLKQVQQLHRWVHTNNVPAIAFGLRTDFRGEPFPGSVALLALADDIEEVKTICQCGKKATMNIRVDAHGHRLNQGPQVSIGGNESYRQVCAKCFYSTE